MHVIHKLPILVLHVNNRCNCRCTMCSIWKSTDTSELTAERLRSYLPDMRTLGVEMVALTGGEPLMHSELEELCTVLKEAGVRIIVLTTGLLLPRHAAMLTRLTDEVIVSLDGPSLIHERIRRVVGSFGLLSAGVAALRDLDPDFPVSGRCTVQRMNCSSLRATVDAAHAMGLRSISFLAADLASTAFNRATGLSIIESAIGLSLSDIADLELEITAMAHEYQEDFAGGFIAESPEKLLRIPQHFRAHLGLAAPVAPRCNAPWVSGVIETDGSMRPCFFHQAIGQADSNGFIHALNSDEAMDFRSHLRIADNEICRRCVCSLWRPIDEAPSTTTRRVTHSDDPSAFIVR
jgi:MoaA/NifB/PqqE/SkfB family radical SAM enzyme